MALADLAAWKAAVAAPHQRLYVNRSATTTTAGRYFTLWAGGGGAAPTTAAVPARDITGALGQANAAAGLYVVNVEAMQAGGLGMLILCDRLSHQGGLSGTAAGAQTTNLATAALTRYTDGVGVWAALDIYTQVGTTATTVSVSYTDDDGNPGQTSPLVEFGGTGHREAARRVLLPLASGDRGVRAVASVTLTGTTGTAGNFGVTLFKPLMILDPLCGYYGGGMFSRGNALLGRGGQMPEILDDACLELVWLAGSSATGVVQGVIGLADA